MDLNGKCDTYRILATATTIALSKVTKSERERARAVHYKPSSSRSEKTDSPGFAPNLDRQILRAMRFRAHLKRITFRAAVYPISIISIFKYQLEIYLL